jgi:hypothetical protein
MQAGRRHEAAVAIERGGPLQNRSATMIRAFLWLGQRLSRAMAAEVSAEADGEAGSGPPQAARATRPARRAGGEPA